MGWIVDLSEKSGDVRRFDEAIRKAKSGIKEACEIWEDMKEEFSERRYSERYSHRDRDDWDDMSEKRYHRY